MSKDDYIILINEELQQITNDRYLIIIYLLAKKYGEGN